MWNPSKKVLFILMFSMCLLAGLSLSFVNWEAFDAAKGIRETYREIDQSVIFFGLSILFMLQYVRKLKEEKKERK